MTRNSKILLIFSLLLTNYLTKIYIFSYSFFIIIIIKNVVLVPEIDVHSVNLGSLAFEKLAVHCVIVQH